MSNHTKLTPEKKETFFEIIRTTGNVSKAARTVGIRREYPYILRDRDKAFAQDWENAYQEFLDSLEDEARRRAVEGVDSEFYDKEGNCIRTKTEYSDTLMIFLLKGGRPEKFKDRQELTGKNGGPIEHKIDATDIAKELLKLAG